MQALSKRIHYGKFVAEAKFLASREEYSSLIRAQDADGLMRLLTDEGVEAKVCRACGAQGTWLSPALLALCTLRRRAQAKQCEVLAHQGQHGTCRRLLCDL